MPDYRQILAAMREACDAGIAERMRGPWRFIDENNPDAGVTNGQGAFMSTRAYRELLEQGEGGEYA